jgi:stalled ribosome alternative rescue factor ArfA
MTARDLTLDEQEELSFKKKTGKTTKADYLRVEQRFWQNFSSTVELKEEIPQHFLHGQNPSRNLLSLADMGTTRWRTTSGPISSASKTKVVERSSELRGWQHATDEAELSKESVRDNFVESVVKDPLFKTTSSQ